MNYDENPTKVYRIVKYSLFLFSLAFFIFAGSKLLNDTIPTAGQTKKLPIYCVDTEEKKVSLSFDAAWGNGRYGNHPHTKRIILTPTVFPFSLLILIYHISHNSVADHQNKSQYFSPPLERIAVSWNNMY